MGELITGAGGNFLCPFYGAIVNDWRIIKSYFDVKTTCFVLR